MTLRSGVSRSVAGMDLGSAFGGETLGIPVYATVAEALDGVDVLIDYTSHDVVKTNTLAAIERGVAVVIGASGPTADDYAEIDAAARARGVGVISSGNFSITAAMAGGRGPRRSPPAAGRDHRLRERHQGRRSERDLTRAGRAPGEGAGAGGDAAARRDRWPDRGAWDEGGRSRGPFGSTAQLLGLDRGHLRASGRAPYDPARRRFVGRAVRRRHAARGSSRDRRVGLTRGLDTLLFES